MVLQGYINLFIIFVVITFILFLIKVLVSKNKDISFLRQLSYLLCFLSFFIIVFATIILFNLPINFKPNNYILNLQPFEWLWKDNIKQRIISEIGPNIIIFIPLGISMPIVFNRMRKMYMTVLVAFVLISSIEFFQYFIGRSSDIDDLIANLLGVIIGYVTYKILDFSFNKMTWWNRFTGDKSIKGLNGVIIRNARLEDAKTVCNLLKQMHGEDYDLEVFKSAYENKLEASNNAIFVAEYEDNVVGITDVSFHQYLVPLAVLLTIENIIIDENCRGRGIGKHLMNFIIEYAKKNNCYNITLTSGLARGKAHKFYENYGFEKNGYRFDYKIEE